ncbi:MAG: class II glutamine amidotransferase, partial [Nitrospinae bacterium]|nr:class II glutamine amidotransferase [Nitrospinota bacterium]
MCGISGIAGLSNISRVLTDSIRQLEYRGYDSCGIAVINEDGKIEVKKNIGAVDHVSTQEDFASLKGTVGIAHTRWATHGEVTRENTHPHTCCKSEFTLVHNGIISNYNQLKEMLTAKGHKFISQTDTEAIVHLVEEEYKKTKDAEKAFTNALQKVDGTFAVVMLTVHEPDKIFCAKNESPLILGIGDESNYIGSDFNAFINHTKNAVILDDWEYAIVTNDRYTIKHISSAEVIEKEITKIT